MCYCSAGPRKVIVARDGIGSSDGIGSGEGTGSSKWIVPAQDPAACNLPCLGYDDHVVPCGGKGYMNVWGTSRTAPGAAASK